MSSNLLYRYRERAWMSVIDGAAVLLQRERETEREGEEREGVRKRKRKEEES